MGESRAWATAILVFALVPAVCEELAFRGFILSGLERQHRTRSAILLSALMFGFLHVLLSLFQQLFNATLLGIVLGLLAVRSRSILPGIVFHFLNNAMAVLAGSYWSTARRCRRSPAGSIATPARGFIMASGSLRAWSSRAACSIALWKRDRGRPGWPVEPDRRPVGRRVRSRRWLQAGMTQDDPLRSAVAGDAPGRPR